MTVTTRKDGRTWTVKIAPACIVLAATAALLTAACSSSTTSSATATTPASSGTPSSAATTSSPAATGAPIKLGYYNQVNSPALNFPEVTVGTQAAVSYINNQLGGVDGHPIQLNTCATAGTPESTQACAQQLAAQHPLAVIEGLDFNQPAAHPVLAGAGIPQLGGSPLLPADFTAKDTFYFGPGTPGALAGEALFAINVLHVKSVGIIYESEATKAQLPFMTGPLDKAKVKYVEVDASTSTDYTGPFSALNAAHQSAILTIFGGSSACVGFGKAYQAQHSTTPVVELGSCRSPDVIKAAGSAQEGWYYTNLGFEDVTSNPSPDGKVMIDAFSKYVHSAPAGLEGSAFELTMTVYSILKAVGPQATPASIISYMQSKSGQIFGGPTWKCGQSAAFPSVCSFKSRFYQVKGNSVNAVDGGKFIDPLAALGG